MYLLLFVDDMLVASKRKLEIAYVKRSFGEEFEMKYLNPTTKIL